MKYGWLAALAALALASAAAAAPPGMRTAARHGYTGSYYARGQLFPTPKLNSRSGRSSSRGGSGSSGSRFGSGSASAMPSSRFRGR